MSTSRYSFQPRKLLTEIRWPARGSALAENAAGPIEAGLDYEPGG